jgi:hypothetical protein
MSDYVNNLMSAIETGDNDQMNTAFNDAMSAKIGEMLQAKKIELAKSIYNNAVAPEVTDDADDQVETEASNGSEEI